MPAKIAFVAFVCSLGGLFLLAACGDGDNGGDPTATIMPQSTATALPAPADTPTPAPDIRQDNLTQQAGLQEFLTASGGVVTVDSISYQDVTTDGVEDAIVPVSSGGEGGNIAVFVFSYQPAGLTEVLRVLTNTSLTVIPQDNGIQVTEASYAPGDPLCCPSDLTTTVYTWDGSAFVSEPG